MKAVLALAVALSVGGLQPPWSSVVYAGRAAGVASIRANAGLIKSTDAPRDFALIGVWRFDAPRKQWQRLVTAKLQKKITIPAGRQVRSQHDDQLLYELPKQAGLYWVEWYEDEHQSSALAFAGPILCEDIMIGEPPTGMIATCVPSADQATAMFVPDPRLLAR